MTRAPWRTSSCRPTGSCPFPKKWIKRGSPIHRRVRSKWRSQIDVIADDPREPPATPQVLQLNWESNGGGFALHNLDFVYTMGDLLRIVESQGASK